MILRNVRRVARLFLIFAVALPAGAHPMGNFSINHYAHLNTGPEKITVRYVLDMAEIPTVSERQTMDRDGDGKITPREQNDYLTGEAITLAQGLSVSAGSKALPLTITDKSLAFRPGAGGLNTLRIVLDLSAPLPALETTHVLPVQYRDQNFAERAGWKEIVATAAPGTSLNSSSASVTDRSHELTAYPALTSGAPPQQTEAAFDVSIGSGTPLTAAADKNTVPAKSASDGTPRDAFTQAIAAKELTIPVMLLGLLLAFVFGAFHALSPGHGKTMVAAYLVGARGTSRHALLLGIIVTITHTCGVFLLGLITLFASQYVVPAKLYPILSAVSGFAVCGVGIWLLISRMRGLNASGHEHPHDHSHDHSHDHDHDHSHDHGHSHGFGSHHHHHDIPEGPITPRALVALGISGGIVPCPSALVVLLAAVALHRIAYGLMLITAFSIGLASVLVIIGLMVVSAAKWIQKAPSGGAILQRLPVASALAITLIGAFLVYRSFVTV